MKLVFLGEFTDFNTFQNETRKNRFRGSRIKKSETERAYLECKQQRPEPQQEYPVLVKFCWYSKDNRKDIDNVAFAKKFILDGLVASGAIKGDSRKFVGGFGDTFFIDKENPRCEVEILRGI